MTYTQLRKAERWTAFEKQHGCLVRVISGQNAAFLEKFSFKTYTYTSNFCSKYSDKHSKTPQVNLCQK